jgi:hypothetical protein
MLVKAKHTAAEFGRDLFPESFGVIILAEDRGIKPFGIKAKGFGNKIPGVDYRLFFEIIAKREITEHFEKGLMASGKTYIFKIVMLASGPKAFLGGSSCFIIPLFEA